MTREHHSERGRIRISGFDPEVVEEREPISDWSEGLGKEAETRWKRALRQFRANRSATLAVYVVAFMALLAFLARPVDVAGVTIQPFSLAPYDPASSFHLDPEHQVSNYDTPLENTRKVFGIPLPEYWMGIDGEGRDMFSRLLTGGRYSISIGFVVVGLTATVGTIYGSISGYYGGWVDEIMMRIVDTIYAFPGLVLALIIVSLFGGGYWQLVVAFSLFGWNGYARVMRGEVLKVKQNEYVMAAKALGARDRTVIFKHVVPNAVAEVIVVSSLAIGSVVIGVAALGFLGLGMPPGTAEWGTMLDQTRSTLIQGPGASIPWHATVFPGGAIFIFVMAMNMIGDGINDALDAQSTGAGAAGGAK